MIREVMREVSLLMTFLWASLAAEEVGGWAVRQFPHLAGEVELAVAVLPLKLLQRVFHPLL